MDLIRRATGPYTSVEDSVLNLCFTIFRTVEKVKVNRERCNQISGRVKSLERLVLTIKQKGRGQNSAMVEETLRELCITLDSVAKEMEKLSKTSALKNALKPNQEDKFWRMDRTLTDILHVLSGTLNIEQGNTLYTTPPFPPRPMAPAPMNNPSPKPPITKCSPPAFMNNPSPMPTADMCNPPEYTSSPMPSTTIGDPPAYTPSPMPPAAMCDPPEYTPNQMPSATIGDPPAYTPNPMASTNMCSPPAPMNNPRPMAPTVMCNPQTTTYYASPMAPTVMCSPQTTTYYASPMASTVMCNRPATTYYASPMAPTVMCSPQTTTYYASPMASTVMCNPPVTMPSYRPLVMGAMAPRLFSPQATVITVKSNYGYSSPF